MVMLCFDLLVFVALFFYFLKSATVFKLLEVLQDFRKAVADIMLMSVISK